MIFIGPSLFSGIGQVTQKYQALFGGQYYFLEDDIPSDQDIFLFALPIKQWLDRIPYYKKRSKSVVCMTVCETETVHPDYGLLFDLFDTIATPSEFCKNVFSRQFPQTTFEVMRHYVPPPITKPIALYQEPYIFYHIGNVMDPRKNVKKIIEAFIRLNLPDTRLVLKATCLRDVTWSIPGVTIINGLKPDSFIQEMHDSCHCYVSFSSSEGVGMGAVEAAMNDKPVIITSYGGAKEYIKTPWTIDCDLQEITADDFLFQKGMQWGRPDFNQLVRYMREAYDGRIIYQDHSFTRQLVSEQEVSKSLVKIKMLT